MDVAPEPQNAPVPVGAPPSPPNQPVPVKPGKSESPTALIVAGALITVALLFNAGFGERLKYFVIAFPAAIVFIGLAALAYLWLNRWAPEPRRMLLQAFVWGSGFSALVAGVVNIVGSIPLIGSIIAPTAEELMKGAFLLMMLKGVRRARMMTFMDFIVYAGFIGLGFGFIESITYISSAEDIITVWLTVGLRLIFGVFMHPFFTTFTAIGLWYANTRPDKRRKYTFLGYLAAIGVHGIWNLTSDLSTAIWGVTYVVIMVPLFIVLVRRALRARKAEGVAISEQLPRLVAEGLVSERDAEWLGVEKARQERFAATKKASGPQAAALERRFATAVSELTLEGDLLEHGNAVVGSEVYVPALVTAVQVQRNAALPTLGASGGQPS